VTLQTYVQVVEGGFIVCHFQKLYAVEVNSRTARISRLISDIDLPLLKLLLLVYFHDVDAGSASLGPSPVKVKSA
jgi:hypothetical protein